MDNDEYPALTRMFGIEMEFFLIDHEGNITNKADQVIGHLKSRLAETEIKQEAGQSMIELTTFPHLSQLEVFGKFFRDYETLLYELEQEDLGILTYATYPGRNMNIMRQDVRYAAKERILGSAQFPVAGRCVGLHFHYTLPRNSFNPNISFFYPDIRQRSKEKVLNLYNLYVALDPALTALMQSSPYFEGKLLGKDARTIMYRGDPEFGKEGSLYHNHPEFGSLNPYSGSFEDLTKSILERSSAWKALLKQQNLTLSDFAKKEASLLDSSWNPVKISPHGTIENRSADMNSIRNVVGLSSLLKTLSKHVQHNSIAVIPSETGNLDPFLLEEDTLHVPEFGIVKKLEKSSGIMGFEDHSVLEYAKGLLRTVKGITDKEAQAPLNALWEMIDEEKTVSDRIIELVKKKQGYIDDIEDETAKGIALESYGRAFKDLVLTKKMAEKNMIFAH